MTKGMNLIVLAGLILALILNSIFVIDEKEDMTTSLQAIAEVAIDDKRRSCMVYRQANQWSNRLQLLVDEAKTA